MTKRTKTRKRKSATAPILKLDNKQMMTMAALFAMQFKTWAGNRRAVEALEDTCHALANVLNNDTDNTVRHLMLYSFFRGQ